MPCLQGAADWARDVMVRARAPRIWTSSRGRAQGGSRGGGRGRRREALGGGGGSRARTAFACFLVSETRRRTRKRWPLRGSADIYIIIGRPGAGRAGLSARWASGSSW
jgi:hypothetical protein